jgi:hypothetical protein
MTRKDAEGSSSAFLRGSAVAFAVGVTVQLMKHAGAFRACISQKIDRFMYFLGFRLTSAISEST